MVMSEVVRGADLLARAWAGSPPTDAGGHERCRQLMALLRRHDPALVEQAERGAAPDAERLQRTLADLARENVNVRTLLGQLGSASPRPPVPLSGQVRVAGTHNHVNVGVLGLDVLRTRPHVLFLAANPRDGTRLRLDQEARDIREALMLTGNRFALETREAVRPSDLTLALMQLRPQVVHFSGHGQSSGAICLEDERGNTHPVAPNALAGVFMALEGRTECVVLNACYSALQAAEIARHVKHVVGMTHTVGDGAALAFAKGFYQAIGSDLPIRQAVAMGRGLFDLLNLPERLAPVLWVDGAIVA